MYVTYVTIPVFATGVEPLTNSVGECAGCRLYKRGVLERIMTVMQSRGYVFQMEVMVRAKGMGYSVGEVHSIHTTIHPPISPYSGHLLFDNS